MFDLSFIKNINSKVLGIPGSFDPLNNNSLKQERRQSNMKHNKGLGVTDLVLPQPIPLCLKFFSNKRRESLPCTMYWGP